MTVPANVALWAHNLVGDQWFQVAEFKELKLERVLQGMEQMTFQVRHHEVTSGLLFEDQRLRFEPNDGSYWIIDHFEDEHPGYKTVVCNEAWVELSWRIKFDTTVISAKTPTEGLEEILLSTGWTVGTSPVSDIGLYTIEGVDVSALSLLRTWAQVTGYELELKSAMRQVNLVPQIGSNRGYGFRYGDNVKSIKRKYQAPQATRIYPLGGNDLNIAGINPTGLPYVEDYDWYLDQGVPIEVARSLYRKDLVWKDDDYLSAVALFDQATSMLTHLSKPQISYTASVVDVVRLMTGVAEPFFKIGDIVRVQDEVLGFNIEARVTRLVQYPLNSSLDEVELGFQDASLLDLTQSQSRTSTTSTLTPILDENLVDMVIDSGVTNYGAIAITVAGNGTVLAGSTFVGVGQGTGTVGFWLALDGTPVGGVTPVTFTDGQVVEFSYPSYATGIDEGVHDVHWRASIISGSGTVLLPATQGRSWLLARGAVGGGGASTPSQYITEMLPYIPAGLLGSWSGEFTIATSDSSTDYWDGWDETLVSIEPEDLDPWTDEFDLTRETLSDVYWLTESAVVKTAGTTFTVTVPWNTLADDVILVFLAQQQGASAVTGPGGFTRIGQAHASDGSGDLWGELWWGVDPGTLALTNLTFTVSGSGPLWGVLGVLRSPSGTVTLDTVAGATYTTNVSNPGQEPLGEPTATGDFRLAVAFTACLYVGAGTLTYSLPAPFTQVTSLSATANQVAAGWYPGVMDTETLEDLVTSHSGSSLHTSASLVALVY